MANCPRGAIVLAAAAAVLLASLIVAAVIPHHAEAQRLRIPRAANAVDHAAGAFEDLCDELRAVVRDCRDQGKVTGAFGVYIVGIPLLAVEWTVNLPPCAEEEPKHHSID